MLIVKSMDLGLGEMPVEQPSKRVATSSHSDKEMQKIMAVIAKLSLSNALQARFTRAMLLDVYRVKADSLFATEIKAATKQFTERAKEIPDQPTRLRMLGLPHVHAWNACLKALRALLDKPEKQEVAAQLGQYCTKAQALGWQGVAEQVKFMRLRKTFNRDFVNLEFNLVPDSDADKVFPLMKEALLSQPEAAHLPGVPPPGDLERRVQRWLEDNGFSEKSRE